MVLRMQNWEYKKLEETCEFLDSKRKPITANKRVPGPYPYYGATGILDYVEDYLFDEELILLGEDGAKWDAGDNSAFLISGKTWVNNHAHVLRPNNIVFSNWIIYFLNYSNLMKYVKGATVPKLNQENARSIEIPLPPLEEQKRIVKILDEKFAMLETVKANAKINLQNAKDLFQSQLTKAFSNTTWEKKRLGEICEVKSGGTPSRNNKSYWENGDIPWVKTTELQNNIISDTEEYITQKGLEESSAKIVPKGTILLAMYGQGKTRGMTAYLDIEATTNQACACILPPKNPNISTEYIWKFLIGNYENVRNLAIGCNQPNLNSIMVKSIEIPLPPLPEQKRIVEQLDSLSQKVRSLEEIYTKQLANCDELKQAFLAKAFAGEL